MMQGRHALVTGAARGIGAAIARVLAQEGARLTLLGRNAQALKQLVCELPGEHGIAVADVADPEQVKAAFELARAARGQQGHHRQCRLPWLYRNRHPARKRGQRGRQDRFEAEAMAEFAKGNPQQRIVQPQEVADAVRWLCSDGASAITGQAISVSAGEIM